MNATIRYAILGLLVGAIGGYALFGKIAGQYVSPTKLISLPQNGLADFGQRLTGVSKVRQNIIISTLVCGVVGAVLPALSKKK